MSATSRQLTLASRPHGAPTDEDFELKTVELPTLKDGVFYNSHIFSKLKQHS